MTRVIPMAVVRDRRPLSDIIAERIFSAVQDGTLKPGQQLPIETELARQFNVGRTSLREALQKLRAMGVIEVRMGLGTFVVDSSRIDPVRSFAQWSAENEFEVSELIETRLALETTAAGLACERASSDEIEALREINRRHQRATEVAELVRTDEEFHNALVAASHNSLLSRLYAMLVPSLREFRTLSLAIPASARRSGGSHHEIVEAVAARDPVRARATTVHHLWTLYSTISSAANTANRSTENRGTADRRVWLAR